MLKPHIGLTNSDTYHHIVPFNAWNIMTTNDYQLIKVMIEAPYYRPFVRGIHRWSMDSIHKGTKIQSECIPGGDVII